MDRNRLKEVQQSDLTESKVNEDFLQWLKKSGPSYLLAIMLVIAGSLGWIKYKRGKVAHLDEAWTELSQAQLGLWQSLEEVAQKYDDVGAVSVLALLTAADMNFGALQTNRPVDYRPPAVLPGQAPLPNTAPQMTEEERTKALSNARRLYQQVVDQDDNSNGQLLFAVRAMNGLAALAEMSDEPDDAKIWYEKAATRCEKYYPDLAQETRDRAATVDQFTTEIILPAASSLPPATPPSNFGIPANFLPQFNDDLNTPDLADASS